MVQIVEEVMDILDLCYQHGWDERNGGNLSLMVDEKDIKPLLGEGKVLRSYTYEECDFTNIIGRYFIITGTGKYFKNVKKDPEMNLGILRVKDKTTVELLWGLKDGGGPTSETPTHLLCHIERLKVDPNHRLVLHCHATNVIAMTFVLPVDSNRFTEELWKIQTESIVVFPEGVAELPWMMCGGAEIGKATAALMKEYRTVIWAQHGIFCTGRDLDETYGLLETIEKAAEIYMKVCDKRVYQTIKNDELKEIARCFNLNYRKGIID